MARPLSKLSLLVCFLLVGCTAVQVCHFGVTGQIAGLQLRETPNRDRLIAELDAELRPLGFSAPHVLPYIKPEIIVFSLGSGFSIGGERIDVRVEPEAMRVSVRDYNQ